MLKYILLFTWVLCTGLLLTSPINCKAAQNAYLVTQSNISTTPIYVIIDQPQPYAISTPKPPELKPICSGYGKDYSQMNWIKCLKDQKH